MNWEAVEEEEEEEEMRTRSRHIYKDSKIEGFRYTLTYPCTVGLNLDLDLDLDLQVYSPIHGLSSPPRQKTEFIEACPPEHPNIPFN